MSSLMGKIVLKNSTKITLNERFTAYREQAESEAAIFRVRQKEQNNNAASFENRRLALQMANRPAVMAALRLKKRSLQNRLGQRMKPVAETGLGTVHSRLNFGGRQQAIANRLGARRMRGMGFGRNQRGRRFGSPRSLPMVKTRLGGFPRNFRQLNQNRSFRGRRRNMQANVAWGQLRRRGRRNFPLRGRNRRSSPLPTKQELDNQLDAYMAETKTTMEIQ